MGADAFDEDLLETAVTRKPVLEALATEPHHRRELQEALDISKTTCHRIVRNFDDEGLLRRTDSGYALTAFGETVAEAVERYDSTVRAAYRLRPLLSTVESAGIDFDVEAFADARITAPEPGDPYPFVDRMMELFRASETIRVLDRSVFVPPLYVEEALRNAIETGMRGEFVVAESIALGDMTELEDLQREVVASEATGKWFVHDDIPFGLAIYDDHVDLRAYDDETDAPLLLVDTDDPDAIEWAESVYERYRDEAVPAASLEGFPDWMPDTAFSPDR